MMFPVVFGGPKVTEAKEHLPLPTSFFPYAQLQITKKIEGFIVSWNMEEIQGITFFRPGTLMIGMDERLDFHLRA